MKRTDAAIAFILSLFMTITLAPAMVSGLSDEPIESIAPLEDDITSDSEVDETTTSGGIDEITSGSGVDETTSDGGVETGSAIEPAETTESAIIEYALVTTDGAVTVKFSTTTALESPYVTWRPLTQDEIDILRSDNLDYMQAGFALGNIELWDCSGSALHMTDVFISFDLNRLLTGAEAIYPPDYEDEEDDSGNVINEDFYFEPEYPEPEPVSSYDDQDYWDNEIEDEDNEDEDEDAPDEIQYLADSDTYLINGDSYNFDSATGGYRYFDKEDNDYYYYFPDEGDYVFSLGDRDGFVHENGDYYSYDDEEDRYYNEDRTDYFYLNPEDEKYYSKDGQYFYFYDETYEYYAEDLDLDDEPDEDKDVDDEDIDDEDESWFIEYGDGDFFYSEDSQRYVFNGRYYYYDEKKDAFFIDDAFETEYGQPEVVVYKYRDYYDNYYTDEELDDKDLDENEFDYDYEKISDKDDGFYYDKDFDRYYMDDYFWYKYEKEDGSYHFDTEFNFYDYYLNGHYGYYDNYNNDSAFYFNKSGVRIYEDADALPYPYDSFTYELNTDADLYDVADTNSSQIELSKSDKVEVFDIVTQSSITWAKVYFEEIVSYGKSVQKYFDENDEGYVIKRLGYINISSLTPSFEEFKYNRILHAAADMTTPESFTVALDAGIATTTSGSLSPFMFATYYYDPDAISDSGMLPLAAPANSASAAGNSSTTNRHRELATAPMVISDNTKTETPDPEKLHGRGVFGKTELKNDVPGIEISGGTGTDCTGLAGSLAAPLAWIISVIAVAVGAIFFAIFTWRRKNQLNPD
jgi:hypothetical protein